MLNKLLICSQVPGSLGGLLSLRELNLSNNRLTSIPASLVQLPYLSSLKLAANRLEVSLRALTQDDNFTYLLLSFLRRPFLLDLQQ